MMRKRSIFSIAILSLLAATLLISGCAKKKKTEMIVATVNDYGMTVDDFNYESKEILRMGSIIGDMPITKEDILDALIVKELLLQEAQKRGLDKDRDFMKTIELYWEQTLIRNLLTKKSRETERSIVIYDDEITDYYSKMRHKIMAKVLVLADEKAGRRLLDYEGDVAEYAEREKEKSSLLYIIPSRLYALGEDNTPLENTIFNMEGDKDRALIGINGKWALIVVEEKVPFEPVPLSTAREDIEKGIRMRKERDIVNEWIDELRSSARIKINRKVLGELR